MIVSVGKKISGYSSVFVKAAASRGRTIAWVTLGAIILFTLILWKIVKDDSEEAARSHFNFRVSEINFSIQKRINAYEQVLRGGIGLFQASDEVKRNDWYVYVKNLNLEKNYPGILGIGFSKVIPPEKKQEHINRIKSEGFPSYTIWPEGKRDIYTSIIYLEPFNFRNQRAFGYDMFSENVRREAMVLARDKGTPAVSAKIILVQEMDEDIQPGFLMYLPLYENPVDSLLSVEDRRKALRGYVYSPFRINDLMHGILGSEFDGIHLEIYDSDTISVSNFMFNSSFIDTSEVINDDPVFTSINKINLNNRTWTIKLRSLPVFEEKYTDYEKPKIVLFSGIAISILILGVAITLTFARRFYNQLEQILGSTGEGIFGIDVKGRCSFINESAANMLGITPESCLNKNIHDLIHHSDLEGNKIPRSACTILKAVETQTGCRVDNEFFWKSNGQFFPVEYTVNPIISNKELKGGVVTFNDITERKKSEKLIADSLKEKEILIKEIHHRVKNNMQIISSLLNMQSRSLSDEKAMEIMQESQNRIRSMALIHEKLYQTKDLTNINLFDYVKDLTNNLISAYRYYRNINAAIDIKDIYLNIDTAIYLGLVINELVTNSLKHAFKDSNEGEILIRAVKKDDKYLEVIIKDNGIGFPKNLNFKATSTLGLQLVSTLMTQLEGTIEMYSNIGAEFKVIIKI